MARAYARCKSKCDDMSPVIYSNISWLTWLACSPAFSLTLYHSLDTAFLMTLCPGICYMGVGPSPFSSRLPWASFELKICAKEEVILGSWDQQKMKEENHLHPSSIT